MSDSERQCSTCQFFQNAHLSGNGWCTHPKRQVASDLKILVRKKELACRNSWGDDLWVDASSNATTPPQAAPRKGFIFASQRIDDEVTSVVDSTSRPLAISIPGQAEDGTDDVVTFTSVRPADPAFPNPGAIVRDNDHNEAANADQAERVRHMARGNRDAIIGARERHALRRTPTRPAIQPDADPSGAKSTTPDRAPDEADRGQQPHAQAEMATTVQRDHRDVTPPVPRSEVEARGNALAPNLGADARFDSVPEINPEVDLPRIREFFRTEHSRSDLGQSTDRSAGPSSTFERVLKRAQEIQTASAVDRERVSNHRNALQEPAPQPRVERPTVPERPARQQTGVVWDVDGERLNIAFDRARAAIDQAPMPVANGRTDWQPGADDMAFTGAEQFEIEVSGHDLDREEVDSDFGDSGHENRHRPLTDDDGPDPVEYQSFQGGAFEDVFSDDSYLRSSKQESPRTSWWRSLNFGRKRRQMATGALYNDHHAWDDDPVAQGGDLDIPEYDLDPFEASPDEWREPAPEPHESYLDSNPAAPYATTEKSWIQDESQFPESPPAAWRDARAQILASQPALDFPPITLPPNVDGSPMDLPEYSPEFDSIRHEPPFFAIDEPDGMDAFRTALFGGRQEFASRHASGAGDLHGDIDTGEFARPESMMHGPEEETATVAHIRDRQLEPSLLDTRSRPSRRQPGHASPASHPPLAFDSGFDIRKSIVDQDDEHLQQYAVASSVPRSCTTCRSFRPSETGDRGWCMNHDAPTHRQMVNADELACRSSIGDWWLAADTSWNPPLNVIRPETPRTDRLVARSDSLNESDRRHEGRVRTSKVG